MEKLNKEELYQQSKRVITQLKETLEKAGAQNVVLIYGYDYEDEQISGGEYDAFINAIGLLEYQKQKIINYKIEENY